MSSELSSCVKVDVAVLDSPPLIISSRSPDGLCGNKATSNVKEPELTEELCGPRLPVPNTESLWSLRM